MAATALNPPGDGPRREGHPEGIRDVLTGGLNLEVVEVRLLDGTVLTRVMNPDDAEKFFRSVTGRGCTINTWEL